jgi:hypothetical protein
MMHHQTLPELVKHSAEAAVALIAIALIALAVEWFANWLPTVGASPALTTAVHWLAYALFAYDALKLVFLVAGLGRFFLAPP